MKILKKEYNHYTQCKFLNVYIELYKKKIRQTVLVHSTFDISHQKKYLKLYVLSSQVLCQGVPKIISKFYNSLGGLCHRWSQSWLRFIIMKGHKKISTVKGSWMQVQGTPATRVSDVFSQWTYTGRVISSATTPCKVLSTRVTYQRFSAQDLHWLTPFPCLECTNILDSQRKEGVQHKLPVCINS